MMTHFAPTAGYDMAWVHAATHSDYAGVILRIRDTSNSTDSIVPTLSLWRRSRVERGVEYAMDRYENLLRRLEG